MILRLRHVTKFYWVTCVQLVGVLLHQFYFCFCTTDYYNCVTWFKSGSARRRALLMAVWPDQLQSCVGTGPLEESGGVCTASTDWSSQTSNPSKSHICRLTGSRHISLPLSHSPLFYGSCSGQQHKAIIMRFCMAMRQCFSLGHPGLLCAGLLCSKSSWKGLLPESQVLTPAFQLCPKLGTSWLWPTMKDMIEWTSLESII